MIYHKTVRYLESFIDYEKIPVYPYKESLNLERIRGFLETIGNPQDALKCIHIAGSKGKGSTCAFIAYILREAGFKTGLYTSPHLSDFRERIRILRAGLPSASSGQVAPARYNVGAGGDLSVNFEGMISKSELTRLVERLKPAIEEYNKKSIYGPLSFFEVYTALAFVYFKEKKTDFAVLETGLGGRLDATNVVNPLVCAITPISYEHTDKLGSSLREIASEKAGIIKRSYQPIVISAPQEKEAMEVIRNRCRQTGAKLYELGRDVSYCKTKDNFAIKGPNTNYSGLRIRLLGEHQLVNASVAVGVIDALRISGVQITIDSVRRGLYNTLWPGRCEIISREPLVVLDGAQNAASAKVLRETIKQSLTYKKLILVLGICNDKDIKGICAQLCDLADEIILTQADNPRAASVDMIADIISSQLSPPQADPPAAEAGSYQINKTKNVKEAVDLARQKANRGDLILITGSLFVVGEARQMCRPKSAAFVVYHARY